MKTRHYLLYIHTYHLPSTQQSYEYWVEVSVRILLYVLKNGLFWLVGMIWLVGLGWYGLVWFGLVGLVGLVSLRLHLKVKSN